MRELTGVQSEQSCKVCKNVGPLVPKRRYCKSCYLELKRKENRVWHAKSKGMTLEEREAKQQRKKVCCPSCWKLGVTKNKHVNEAGKTLAYCYEHFIKHGKTNQIKWRRKKGIRPISELRAQRRAEAAERGAKKKEVIVKPKADLELPAASPKALKEEARVLAVPATPKIRGIDVREAWVAEPMPTPPADMLRAARLDRIRRDGPKYSDSAEDIAASGWVPLEMAEVIRRRHA